MVTGNGNNTELFLPFGPQTLLARALYDNRPDCSDELAFCRGDILTILEQNVPESEGWWRCSLHGRRGLAPANRLQVLRETPADRPWPPSPVGLQEALAASPKGTCRAPTLLSPPPPSPVYEHMKSWVEGTASPTVQVYELPDPPAGARIVCETMLSFPKQVSVRPKERHGSGDGSDGRGVRPPLPALVSVRAKAPGGNQTGAGRGGLGSGPHFHCRGESHQPCDPPALQAPPLCAGERRGHSRGPLFSAGRIARTASDEWKGWIPWGQGQEITHQVSSMCALRPRYIASRTAMEVHKKAELYLDGEPMPAVVLFVIRKQLKILQCFLTRGRLQKCWHGLTTNCYAIMKQRWSSSLRYFYEGIESY